MDKEEKVIGILDPDGYIRDNKCYRGGSTYNTCRERQNKGVKESKKKCQQVGIVDNAGYEKVNRVYQGFCCPTLTSRDYKDPIKVKRLWKKRKGE